MRRAQSTHASGRSAACTRRAAIIGTASAVSALGWVPRAWGRPAAPGTSTARSVVFVFLSGGLSQIDSFDPKPDAPEEIRGEFATIATATPGLRICEHLPRLAATSRRWSVVRSLTHPSNDHSVGHHIVLTGRSELPSGFDPNQPRPADWPSMAAVASAFSSPASALPAAVVLPERLVHNTGRVIPGQFAGLMGPGREPWFLELSPFAPRSYGAFPAYEFDHQDRSDATHRQGFSPLPFATGDREGSGRLERRWALREALTGQAAATAASDFERLQQQAAGFLLDTRLREALDPARLDARQRAAYGDHSFGWSLVMARRLVELDVPFVQVNLGNNETWDTHGNAFPHLKEQLLPPLDQALCAFLEDLEAAGLLDTTLVVMAGEFGRTPRISHLPQHYKLPGRDHWGRVQSVLLAGGGVPGGAVVGASDRIGGFPAASPQTPENLAATIYDALGIPADAQWRDAEERPHAVYHARPIRDWA